MTQRALIRFIPSDRMPGALRKTLEVPEGFLALLVQGSQVAGRLDPGRYRLVNWPRPAPDAVLLPTGSFDLRPRIQRLRSGDGEQFDLLWPVTVRLQDAARFYGVRLAPAANPELALVDLEDHIAGRLWESAEAEARRYELGDLRVEDNLHAALGNALMPGLTSLLSDLGLTLTASRLPEPRTLEEDRELLRTLRQAERAARDARFEALFERLEDREMLEQRLLEWAEERGEPPPDATLVDRLWQAVETGPEEAAGRAQRAADALDREVKALTQSLEAERSENERRFHQFEARLETAEKHAAEGKREHEIPWLKRVGNILQGVGVFLTVAGLLWTWLAPDFREPYDRLKSVSEVASGVGAGIVLLSRILFPLRIRHVQQEIQQEKGEAGRAGLDRRRAADRLVRARVEAGLKEVAESLEAAWRKALWKAQSENRGAADARALESLATDLRLFARGVQTFEEKDVRGANYLAGKYLGRDAVPEAELGAMLDLDDDLLVRSQALAKRAEALFEQVNEGLVDGARSGLRELENGLNALRNRFIERGAYL